MIWSNQKNEEEGDKKKFAANVYENETPLDSIATTNEQYVIRKMVNETVGISDDKHTGVQCKSTSRVIRKRAKSDKLLMMKNLDSMACG